MLVPAPLALGQDFAPSLVIAEAPPVQLPPVVTGQFFRPRAGRGEVDMLISGLTADPDRYVILV